MKSNVDSTARIAETGAMRMGLLRLAALAVAVLAAAPASASAALTASDVSVVGQRAYVRVVIDFAGGSVDVNGVHATDPKPADGLARVEITHAGLAMKSLDVKRVGVRARLSVSKAPTKALVQMFVTPRKFKYVRISAVKSQLMIELYRSAPPSRSAEIATGRNGCLTLTSVQGSGTSFVVAGTERNVFEGSFVIRVRDETGLSSGRAS